MSTAGHPVSCVGLQFAYRGRPPVTNGVSLTIGRGEIFCLLGPNGAGKTTLIRQITGDLRPASGTVEVLGVDPAKNPSRIKRRLGIIPQTVSLFENLSVRGHLECFAAIKGIASAARAGAIAEVVAACAIDPLLDRPARALSGGQQRSVLVALALLGDPDVLILDEPTVGLDPLARRDIWRAVEAQRRRGKAILLTTHHLEEAERLATRLAFIDKGAITHQGTQAEFLAMLDFRVKLTERGAADDGGDVVHLLGSLDEARTLAATRGAGDFSISAANLEDVYVHLAGGAAMAVTPL